MNLNQKTLTVLKTPISYSLVGSFFIHFLLVFFYGTILNPEKTEPTRPRQKFKIEMVQRQPKPVEKVKVREKKVKKVKQLLPEKVKTSQIPYAAKQIQKKEIEIRPVSQMVPKKAKSVEERSNPPRQALQLAKANISKNPAIVKPRNVETIQVPKHELINKQSSVREKAKPADFTPPPRPVENLLADQKFTVKEVSFHKSSAGFASSTSKSKPMPVSALNSNEGKAAMPIHDKIKFTPPSNNFRIQAPSTSIKNELGLMKSQPHLIHDKTVSIDSTLSEIKPSEISRVTSSSQNFSPDRVKASLIHKGELVAAATFPRPRPVPTIVDQKVLDGYLQSLQGLIVSAKRYPEAARKSGKEGKVTVQFTVMNNGEVKNIQLLAKTDYPELNNEAINAVKRVAPFSSFPDEIDKSFLKIVLPFRFKLNE